MRKLSFSLNRLLVDKAEDQRVGLPVERELNEQELATATGGWCGGPSFFFHRRCFSSCTTFSSFGGWGGGCGGWGGGCGGGCGGWGGGCCGGWD